MELNGQIQNGGSLNGSFGYDSGDYELLTHKPQINGVTLIGNKTSADLHIGGGTDDYNDLDNKPMINGVQLSGNLSPEDLGLAEIIYPDDPTLFLNGSGFFAVPDYFSGDYDDLTDKPQINGVTLSGNKSTSDLLVDYDDLSGRPKIDGTTLTGDKTPQEIGCEPSINYPGDATQYLNGEGNFTTPDYFSGDYEDLSNLPQINGVTLSGNLDTGDLLLDYDDISGRPSINSHILTGNQSGNDLELTSGAIASGSGTSVNFEANDVFNLIKCEIDFEPDQTGSGTPSTSNPRPINGHSTITINQSPTSDPQEGTDIVINLGDTYYTGHLDIKKGKLTIKDIGVAMDSLTWSILDTSGSLTRYYADITGMKKAPVRSLDILCSIYPANIGGGAWVDNTIWNSTNLNRVIIVTSEFVTLADFEAAMIGQTVVVEREADLEINITPEIIQTLIGDNYITTEDGTLMIESATEIYDPVIKYLINNL